MYMCVWLRHKFFGTVVLNVQDGIIGTSELRSYVIYSYVCNVHNSNALKSGSYCKMEVQI